MSIDVATVRHYAKLANLDFDDSEAEVLATQLGTVLEHVAKLAELDLDDVQATAHMRHEVPRTREDELGESLGSEAAMANAPDVESHHFLVPKVISVK